MNIILGKNLDGPSVSHLTGTDAACGQLVIGQLRFMSLLETAYAFPPARENALIRTAQYERALAEYDNGHRFYSASFTRDSGGVAAYLLGARDEILMSAPAEFSFNSLAACRNRLQTLARVETLAKARELDPGFGERLRAVIAEIKKNRIPNPVQSIILTDPATSWQKLWIELFGLLKSSGTEFTTFKPELPQTIGDLACAQASVAGNAPVTKVDPAGDGSVGHLVGHTPFEAADAAAVLIKRLASKDGPENVAIIREKYPDLLDDALARHDLALLGSSRETPGWTVLQVLPYLVSFLSEPLDPDGVRAFLLLPISPIPDDLKKSLLDALCQVPSVTSQGWHKAVRAYQSKTKKEQGPAADLTSLFLSGKRTKGDEVPISRVTDLCQKTAAWARAEEREDEERGFGPCAEAAETLVSVLDLKKEKDIGLPILKTLVSEAVLSQADTCSRSRQAGAVLGVTSPGSILRPVKHVVWWCACGSTVQVPAASMWTANEWSDLKKNKVDLQDPKDEFTAQAIRWRRAVQMAAGSLTLVSMENTGEEDEPHPIWHEVLDGFTADDVKTAVLTREVPGTDDLSRTTPIAWPGFKEQWQADAALLTLRDPESPSSVELLAACPLHWVLKYPADINDPSHFSLADGRQLFGNLVHEILETYLAGISGTTWPASAEVEKDIAQLFEERVGDLAGIMDLPGWAAERSAARDQIIGAAVVLVTILKETRYKVGSREKWVRAGTELGPLQGRTDLILEEPGGPGAILDIKSGSKTWYRQSLKEGRAFQLAAYSRLLKKKDGPWPITGYFVVSSAELFTTHPGAFPGSIVIEGPAEEESWQVLQEKVKQVVEELKQGKVPLGIPEADWKKGDTGAVMPAQCGFCNYKLFCGL